MNSRFLRRKTRTRSKIWGSAGCPRLSVFRSNRSIYAQIINDDTARTLIGLSSRVIGNNKVKSRIDRAYLLGEEIAKRAKKIKVGKVVFDRSGYKYHGQVQAVAEGARKGGLVF